MPLVTAPSWQTFIMALVRAWPSTYGPSFADAAAQRATVVVEAVRRLTQP
jgi:hypothetical protein